ncbi:MAG: hypothetical protein Q8934_15445 [Bacillota bacterium]|nr:hypothetical protein [Bacillota bacterium]
MKLNTIEDTLIQYEILDFTNHELVTDTAECLSETFIGYQTKDQIIREPMCYVIDINRNDFDQFVLEYVQNVAEQGYCFIAKDSSNGKVIGAYACEVFDPSVEEIPVFEGSFEPFNRIMELLGDLDSRFLKTLEEKLGRKPLRNEYLHAFMLGVRTEKNRKEIANKLIKMSLEKAELEGLKGCFLEATSFKSQIILTKYFDFYLPIDSENKPILTTYSETNSFSSIPATIGENCQILYRSLNGTERI